MSRDKGYGVNMKRRKARIFAIVLALSMVISLFIVPTVSAADTFVIAGGDPQSTDTDEAGMDSGSAVGMTGVATGMTGDGDVVIPAQAGISDIVIPDDNTVIPDGDDGDDTFVIAGAAPQSTGTGEQNDIGGDVDSGALDSGSAAGMTGGESKDTLADEDKNTDADNTDGLVSAQGAEIGALDAADPVVTANTSAHWIDAGTEFRYTIESLSSLPSQGIGDSDTRTPTPVTTWNTDAATGLYQALELVNGENTGIFNENKPYVIYVGSDINMTGRYQITNKNIELRKASGVLSAEILQTMAGSATVSDSRHFYITGATSKLVLENGIALDGGFLNDGTDISTLYKGGIYTTATRFIFKGEIRYCRSATGGAISYNDGRTIELIDVHLHHNIAGDGNLNPSNTTGQGGAIAAQSWQAYYVLMTISGDSIIEDNFSGGYGGAIGISWKMGNVVTIKGNTKIINNRGANGGAIYCHGGILELRDNAEVSGNITDMIYPKDMAQSYPGTGGGIYFSGGTGTTTFNMRDNAKISNNVTANGGGGIYMQNANTVTLNLYDGEISGNIALGTARESLSGASAFDKISPGAGAGILAAGPQNIKIPVGSTITFFDNSAPFIALTELSPNTTPPYETPIPYQAVFPNDTNYKSHILDPTLFEGSNNSAKFSAPYNNLYNGYDIGVPNNSATAFGKLKIVTSAGGSVIRSGTFANVFPAGQDWIGLDVDTAATFTPMPDPGYRFTGWIRESSTNLLATEWTTAMNTSNGTWTRGPNDNGNATDDRNGAKAPGLGTDKHIDITAMPAADITLTANFEIIPKAFLSGFSDMDWSADLDTTTTPPTYPQPSLTAIALENSVANSTATNVTLSLSDFKKNGEVWSGTTDPFALTGSVTSIAGGVTDSTWKVQPSGALEEFGNYTATLTLSYQNGVDTAPIVSQVQLSFALIDPDIPLFVLGSVTSGTVVGSSYIVQTEQMQDTDYRDVDLQPIHIQNLSANAKLLNISLAGAGANDFDIIPGNKEVAANAPDSSWKIVPKPGLAPGVHEAMIRVGYEAADGSSVMISSVAPITFTVLKPAELSANPIRYSFPEVPVGYMPALEDIVLTNNGDVPGFITGIAHKSGADAFTTIDTSGSMATSGEVEVGAGGTDRSFEIAPIAGLPRGFYTEVLTVSYYSEVSGGAIKTGTVDITASIPVDVSGNIVTVNYLDINGGAALRDPVSLFVETGEKYTPSDILLNPFIMNGKNYGYYGYKVDGENVTKSEDLPAEITVTADHNVNYYYGTLDVTVNAGLHGSAPSVNGNGSSMNVAYGSTVEIGVDAQTGYSFNGNWNPDGSYTGTPPTGGSVLRNVKRASASFTAGYGTLTLTPGFALNEYAVVIDAAANGGTGGSTVSAVKMGDAVTITTLPSRDFSSLLGYAVAPEGPVAAAYNSGFILDATMISALFASDTEDTTTLYAIFAWMDTTKPIAQVEYKTNGFKAFLNKITFGLFFKATVAVEIEATDTQSGVAKVEYFMLDSASVQSFASEAAAIDFAENYIGTWTEGTPGSRGAEGPPVVPGTPGTASFSITPAQLGERQLFVRVTDYAGNSDIFFDGLLVYEDSTQAASLKVDYTKLGADLSIPVALNGNTVKGIVNNTDSNTPLGPTDFASAAGSDNIQIDSTYLNGLDIRTYVFTVSYYPQDKTYSADSDDRVEQPTTTTFEILVHAAAQNISLTGLSSEYTYGDVPDTDIGITGGSGSGGITYSVTSASGAVSILGNSSDSGTTATLTIIKPGTFTVTATKAGDATYGSATTTSSTITVNKAVPAVSVSGSGGANLNADVLLNATVSKASPSAAVPTGSVDIYVDSVFKATENLVGGEIKNYNLGKLSGGSHTLEVRYNGDNYYKGYSESSNTADLTTSGAKDDESFSVDLASDSIAIAPVAAKVYGDSDFTLSLSTPGAGSGPVTWALDSSSAGSTVATIATDGTVHITGTGSVTFRATKAPTTDHNGCSATITINIGKATPTLATPPSGSGITYGQMLSDSMLSGGSVTGYGTDSGSTLSGTFTWTTLNEIPDVTGLNTANDYYSVTWTPSSADADHYDPVTSTVAQNTRATLTVGRANVTLATPLHGSGINTGTAISNSVISGGEVTYLRGGVDTPVSGSTAGGRVNGWVWNTPAEDFSMYGPVTRDANWAPLDTARFNVIANAPVTIYVYSPQTEIKVAPTASGITYGDPVSLSNLDTTLAAAWSVGANPGPDVQIPGTWYWSSPSVIAGNAGAFAAEVTFKPDYETTTPDQANTGYVRAYANVDIPVAKATPTLVNAQAGVIKNGDTLSQSAIGVYSFKGVSGEVVTGTLTWKTGSIVPSDSLGANGVGVYQATAVFTPDSSFDANYKEIEVLVPVNVTANKDALSAYNAMVLGIDIHEENYKAAELDALRRALIASNLVLEDATATQAEVDKALSTLKAAFEGLKQDHPELKSSHDVNYGGVNHLTKFGDTVRIEFKGDIRDVTGFALDGKDYPLTSGGVNVYDITENGSVVGTITKGSAVVTFPAAFADRFANGTHKVEVFFTDAISAGNGTADLVVDRQEGEGNSDRGPAIRPPQTGDDMAVDLMLAVALLSLCGLLILLFVLRRRRKEKTA
ncbi:hypothetical protein AGMMS49983_15440 [Clostridia bacterium]|nr:hypothetical protein AGMMS49983_15440 [Clostridia bacterium]